MMYLAVSETPGGCDGRFREEIRQVEQNINVFGRMSQPKVSAGKI